MIRLDSYQCESPDCGAFFHLPQEGQEIWPEACPYCGHNSVAWMTDENWRLVEVGSWHEQALWAITKGDVDATATGYDLNPEEREILYHQVEKMDASLVMDQLQDLVDNFIRERQP